MPPDEQPPTPASPDATTTIEPSEPSRRRSRGWLIAIGIIVLLAVFAVAEMVGGEAGQFINAGIEVFPFAILAVLAYYGVGRTWAKVAALLWLGALVVGTAAFTFFFSYMVVQPSLDAPLDPAALGELGLIGAGILLALVAGATCFVRAFRRALARVLPIDPDSFVHTVALVAVVAMTIIGFVPLLVLAEPPLLAIIERDVEAGIDLTGGRGRTGMLLDDLYGLAWLVPGAMVAVGLGIRRTFRQSLTRLGLVWPTRRQVLAGFLFAVGMVAFVTVLGIGIDWLWGTMGWPTTDEEVFGKLLEYVMSPVGAIVIGVTAGLGEELAVRGALQPRVGILLSNLFFTGMHAFQYNFDALVTVFLAGLILGLIRARTNTTTSAITHGSYDALLVVLSLLSVPGFE